MIRQLSGVVTYNNEGEHNPGTFNFPGTPLPRAFLILLLWRFDLTAWGPQDLNCPRALIWSVTPLPQSIIVSIRKRTKVVASSRWVICEVLARAQTTCMSSPTQDVHDTASNKMSNILMKKWLSNSTVASIPPPPPNSHEAVLPPSPFPIPPLLSLPFPPLPIPSHPFPPLPSPLLSNSSLPFPLNGGPGV
jgi:hypothetical protein